MHRHHHAAVLRTSAALIAGSLLVAGCSTLQQEADSLAAGVADHALRDALTTAVDQAGPRTSEARVAAASAWLATPDTSKVPGRGPLTWSVRGVDDGHIRVDVYRYAESGSFFPPDQGDATWGVACRAYDVTDPARTTAIAIECPPGTPSEP